MTNTPISIDRKAALDFLREACKSAAEQDYAYKFTDNEEDLRACIYHRVRATLDADERWRVFLSFTTLHPGRDTVWRKPDLVFLRGEPVHTNVSLEILVELKNWPNFEQMRYDLNKLIELRKRFPNDHPDLVFFGVVGDPFRGHDMRNLEASVIAALGISEQEQKGIHVWLYNHDDIFKGPWPDPYRQKLKVIAAAANETAS